MRLLLLACGWMATALGFLGVFLPLLPTTPFLLLAVACFARSSPRCRQWLFDSPLLGPVLKEYMESRRLPRRAKWTALLLLWPTAGWAATQVLPPVPGGLLLLLAAVVSLYLLRLPVAPRAAA